MPRSIHVGERPAHWRQEERHGCSPAAEKPPCDGRHQVAASAVQELAVFRGVRGCRGPLLTNPEGQGGARAGQRAAGRLPEDALGKDPPLGGASGCVWVAALTTATLEGATLSLLGGRVSGGQRAPGEGMALAAGEASSSWLSDSGLNCCCVREWTVWFCAHVYRI